MITYGFTKKVNESYDRLIENITKELKKEGFGVLTRIDIHEKFKEKLDIDFQRYTILGACNPSSAHQAVLAEENIGLMLPCNVIIYEKDEHCIVSIIKPTIAMGMIDNNELRQIAETVEKKLETVFKSI